MLKFVAIINRFMDSLPRNSRQIALLAFDMAAGAFATWLAYSVRLETFHVPDREQLLLYVASMLVFIPPFVRFGLYRSLLRFNNYHAAESTLLALLVHGCLFFLVFSFLHELGPRFPRSVALLQPIYFGILVLASRFALRTIVRKLVKLDADHKRIVVWGANSLGGHIAATLTGSTTHRVIAFIDENQEHWGGILGKHRIYGPEWLARTGPKSDIHEVLIAMPHLTRSDAARLRTRIEAMGFKVNWIPAIEDLLSGKFRIAASGEFDPVKLLNRPVIAPDEALMRNCVAGRVVLVTGAGGSIGSELCRQALAFGARHLIMVDQSERLLFQMTQELQPRAIAGKAALSPRLGNVRILSAMQQIMAEFRPDIVFHAAAYKHVPIVEANPAEGMATNLFGTLNIAQAALEAGVGRFVFVSTDKAVRPSSMMGASKRLAELGIQALGNEAVIRLPGMEQPVARGTVFCAVRFGNVLDSSGSVVPIFRQQILAGGPLTVRHADATRYFMAIPEAAQLVIQAAAMAEGGEIFVLDMGKPVRIIDLARRMIAAAGLSEATDANPDGDIAIQITGLKAGEKLHEELVIGTELRPTMHPKITSAHEKSVPLADYLTLIEPLRAMHPRQPLPGDIASVIDYAPSNHSIDRQAAE
ncbi:MAG: polysaccharide biosynthesis protein [Rhizobiaceae bacterium]|jgi:FlaA1/EpsC-like NDP-sugar epimerase|nr:polysaccharide biosynthesis protein [Rhizobiaceae bacterium]